MATIDASSLIKSTAVPQAARRPASQAAQDTANRVTELDRQLRNVYLKKWGPQFLDPSLNVYEGAVLDAIRILEFAFKKCREPIQVIASVARVSERTARRAIGRLVELGKITRERSPYVSLPDTLAFVDDRPDGSVGNRERARSKDHGQCKQCNVFRTLDAVGVCVVCRKRALAEREVAEALASGPAALEFVYSHLKAHGSKSSANDIRRAYVKATERAA